MKRPMDHQKKKVYKAEGGLRKLSKTYETLPEVEAYIKSIFKTEWFKKRYPSVCGVELASGAGARIARGNLLTGGIVWMKLPKWARNDAVILHELAHGLVYTKHSRSSVAVHGREFCETLYELVRRYMGPEAAKMLRDGFQANKVKFRPKRTLSPQQRELAIARIRKFQKQPGIAAKPNSPPESEMDRLRASFQSMGIKFDYEEIGLTSPPAEALAAHCYITTGQTNFYFDKAGYFLGHELTGVCWFSRQEGVIPKT